MPLALTHRLGRLSVTVCTLYIFLRNYLRLIFHRAISPCAGPVYWLLIVHVSCMRVERRFHQSYQRRSQQESSAVLFVKGAAAFADCSA